MGREHRLENLSLSQTHTFLSVCLSPRLLSSRFVVPRLSLHCKKSHILLFSSLSLHFHLCPVRLLVSFSPALKCALHHQNERNFPRLPFSQVCFPMMRFICCLSQAETQVFTPERLHLTSRLVNSPTWRHHVHYELCHSRQITII